MLFSSVAVERAVRKERKADMALKSLRGKPAVDSKTVANMIREAIEKNGYRDVKECARGIKVPYDLFNKVVGGHIPKDAQLVDYAKKLKIDSRELILAAYREKAPDDMKRYFNSVQLLENHKPPVEEMIAILDDCNPDQLDQLLQIARMIHNSPRDYCRKALSLLKLYQQLDVELMTHLDSLILLALRNDSLPGLKQFRETANHGKSLAPNRRGRMRV